MSSKSKRNRHIRPHEQANVDQVLAAANDYAAHNPRTAIAVTEYVNPDTHQCCWCDCPDELHHGRLHPPDSCLGCPRGATRLVRDLTLQISWPICDQHYPDLMRFHADVIYAGIPRSYAGYDAYDPE
jgi:hypothetical protein